MKRILVSASLIWGLCCLADLPPIYMVCVDCYGTASLYPSEARKLFPGQDIRWIHVRSEKDLQPCYAASFRATEGEYRMKFDAFPDTADQFGKLIRILKPMGVKGVIGGMETGAVFADRLNKALELDGNDPDTSHWRREKAAMQEAMGDLAIPTRLAQTVEEMLAFVATLHSDRVVFKPNASSSAEGVVFIDRNDRNALEQAFRRLRGTRDQYGHAIDAVVVQPEIVGPEFVINSIASRGFVTATAIWKYEKMNPTPARRLYFADIPWDLTNQIAKEASAVAAIAHQRLGNFNAPGHGEFIREVSTGRWYMVEQAARVAGAGMAMMDSQIWGIGHLQLNLLRVLDHKRYLAEVQTFPRRKVQDGACLFLVSRKAGKVREGSNARLKSLPTYYVPAPHFDLYDGSEFGVTEDLKSSPGVINLVGPYQKVLKDAEQLVRWQADETLLDYGSLSRFNLVGRCSNRIQAMKHQDLLFSRYNEILWP